MVVGLLWQLDEGHGQQGSAPRSVTCVVHVIALVTRVSSIGRVCLAINAVGCLGAAQIIKSVCVPGAIFFFFFC